MAFMVLFSPSIAATLLILVVTSFFFAVHRLRASQGQQATKVLEGPVHSEAAVKLGVKLSLALPDNVTLPQDTAVYYQLVNSHWAKQECQVAPACIARPRNVDELCVAIKIIKHEYDQRDDGSGGLFAIRSGGHSPVANAASIKNGVLIDMGLFCEVAPSEDGSSVVIGTGARWGEVYDILEKRGLAVVGGRSSEVGVGGLTLGGEFKASLVLDQTIGRSS